MNESDSMKNGGTNIIGGEIQEDIPASQVSRVNMPSLLTSSVHPVNFMGNYREGAPLPSQPRERPPSRLGAKRNTAYCCVKPQGAD